MNVKRIDVTQPFLPPLEEFIPYLRQIWDSKILSNCGPLHVALEAALEQSLGVENLALLSNGTMALLMALAALEVTGEVITTPFSFVASTHVLEWRGLTPVFVDIDPNTLAIDPTKIEAAITERTTAILAVHVYGQPCDVAALRRIADAHGLKLIYDAAHSFGVEDDGGSILRHGDASVVSFHATKVFSTLEGGAVICRDKPLQQRVARLRNFGFEGEDGIIEAGINGKMNEIQAAFGLAQLAHMDQIIATRRSIDGRYRMALRDVPGLSPLSLMPGIMQNYSYFPILVGPDYGESRDELYLRLRRGNIYARRYFYPLISNIALYSGLPSAVADNLPAANRAARQVLCLPISPALDDDDVARVIDLLRCRS
jgi:dTDP-4-amino-4,6-dideoxygalactose transaminase